MIRLTSNEHRWRAPPPPLVLPVLVARPRRPRHRPAPPELDLKRLQARLPGDPVEAILRDVATITSVSIAEMKGRDRRPSMSRARRIAMWLLYRLGHGSFPVVAGVFGREHTTVVHHVAVVDERIASDPVFAATMATLKARHVGA